MGFPQSFSGHASNLLLKQYFFFSPKQIHQYYISLSENKYMNYKFFLLPPHNSPLISCTLSQKIQQLHILPAPKSIRFPIPTVYSGPSEHTMLFIPKDSINSPESRCLLWQLFHLTPPA